MLDSSHHRDWTGLDLDRLFKTYFSRVHRLKKMILKGRIDQSEFSDVDIVIESGRDEAEFVSTCLHNCLDAQQDYVDLHARNTERHAYRQARYLMAALTDEIFLVEMTNWRGQPFWSDYLLEKRLFGTSNAGEEVVRRINEILQASVLTQAEKQLAHVYLLALCLGFTGFKGEVDRRLLMRKVSPLQPRRRLFPAAYSGIVKRSSAERVSPLARWKRRTVYLFLFYCLSSSIAWFAATSSLRAYLS